MSNQRKRAIGALATLGAAAAVLALSAGPALADPVNPDTGAYTRNRTLNGTGSDTTQDLNNALAAVVTNQSGALILGSWDATVPSGQGDFIVTRTGGTSIPRPNGSGQGVAALRAAVDGQSLTNPRGTSSGSLNSNDLQFARSSSGVPYSTSGDYSYVPLAVDAVTYAVANANTTLPRNLSVDDLTAIYSASNGDTVTTEAGSSYVIGTDLVPFLPQTGSGTRSFFIGELGLTEQELGSAVRWTYGTGNTLVQEHDGAVLDAIPNAIVPFSIAQYIAQSRASNLTILYSVSVVDRRHSATLAKIDGIDPIRNGVLNTAFPVKRAVFTVVEYDAIASNTNLAYAFIDNPSTASVTEGAVYWAESPDGESYVIEDFGFGSLINRDTLGNGVTIKGNLYKAGDAASYRTN
ncbi:MAG: hypothetical protein LBC97_14375 [Bifidobacteriaceae bacterium]|jgi:ABC-type phosphate transport system substrate-binding protein|nr:hypothetical protein [Bifidobacteriaceae bacterium]